MGCQCPHGMSHGGIKALYQRSCGASDADVVLHHSSQSCSSKRVPWTQWVCTPIASTMACVIRARSPHSTYTVRVLTDLLHAHGRRSGGVWLGSCLWPR